MRILIVDDSSLDRQLLLATLTQWGHTCAVAANGLEATQLAAADAFDLILMDGEMPVMNGVEAVRQIRAGDKTQRRFTPVVFVSAADRTESVVAGLTAGADDYLTKPVNWEVLSAKLKVFERIAAQHRELQEYQDHQEAAKAFGREVLEALTRATSRDDMVRVTQRSVDVLSGDLFAAARAPNGVRYAMLADGMGHGLPAALSTVLLADLFYAMSGRARPLLEIATEANAKLKRLLPSGFFVAAAFARLEPETRRIEVWNGGMPALHFHGGSESREFHSNSPALAVLKSSEFDSAVQEFIASGPGELLMMSDGFTEAMSGNALERGMGYESLATHLSRQALHDDATLAAISLR